MKLRLGTAVISLLATSPAFSQTEQAGAAAPAPAPAPAPQTADAEAADTRHGLDEIVVTARRRAENLQNVPVVVTAFDSNAIERLGINNVNDVAALTPGFRAFTDGGGSAQGVVAIRGVSTGFLVSAGNQAVSLNIDGIQLSNAGAYRPAQIDLGSIEVLKGPQALFFGKNSTAGIVSIRSADPTNVMFTELTGGYEFAARQRYGQMIVSGPVSDTLSARAVVYVSDQDGYQKNTSLLPVANRRGPNNQEMFSRLTLAWSPSDSFTAKAKLSYFHANADAREPGMQRVNCVAAKLGDDCTADDRLAVPDFPGKPPFSVSRQYQAVLDMNLKVAPDLSLNSISGYQDYVSKIVGNTVAGELINVAVGFNSPYRTLSQELRLTSEYSGPFNFMLGGFYERADSGIGNVPGYGLTIYTPFAAANNLPGAIPPGVVVAGSAVQNVRSKTYSAFGQARFKPVESLEIAAGLRYSSIDAHYSGTVFDPGTLAFAGSIGKKAVAPLGPIPVSRPDRRYDNLSPEVSLTWRPTQDATLFGAYKKGFKAGSYDLSVTNNPYLKLSAPTDISYDSEQAEGGEIGLKTEWFDRTLRFNVSAYHYTYTNLQLSAYDPASVATRVTNAGKSRVKGIEGEFLYAPPGLVGLSIFASANYNLGRFVSFIADCTQSQIAGRQPGCVERNGVAGLQTTDANNVAGKPLPFAPEWAGNFGLSYDSKKSTQGNIAFRINALGVFSSSYSANSSGGNDPLHVQKGYLVWNAGAGIYATNGAWELNLRVDNITNKYYRLQSVDIPNFPLEVQALISPPRMIGLELKLRPSAM